MFGYEKQKDPYDEFNEDNMHRNGKDTHFSFFEFR